jgi:two-component SAPR family response regulator
LGGHGSQTGNQLINPHSYFDLIGYSIKDNSLFKKFEIPRLIDDMVVANTIWINKNNRDYYALIFSKIKFDGELQLIKGNLDSPEVEEVGNKIPFKFLDVRSLAHLFYLPNQDKLYALTTYSEDTTTQVAIYSIDNPPNKADVVLTEKSKSSNFKFYIAIVLVLLIMATTWIVVRRRKNRQISNEKKNRTHVGSNVSEGDLTIESFMESPKYNIIFFGGFQVFNKEFDDITNKFSPLLKELFLLILLHTYKNNKGISSNKITEVLWYDKSEKSARNNRAVNIAKLRGILEEVGSCELSKKTGYWKIELKDSNIKSDYVDLLNISTSKNNLTKQNVNHLIDITRKGAFLSNVYYDWLDDFKANVSDRIIDTLVDFAKSCDVKKESEFIIHLADCIFNFDQVDEDAMILKCKAQYCMGKHSHAKATYAKFSKEYKVMYGQEYDKAFLDILEIKE